MRSFQWGNEGEKSLMLANINSLVKNFPEGIKKIDITNSMYQVFYKCAKDFPELCKDKTSKEGKGEFLQNNYSEY